MSTIVGVETSNVISGLFDPSNVSGGNAGTKTPSCMGLPGAGKPAAYLYFEASIGVLVDDAQNVYAAVLNGVTKNGSISGSEFPSRLYIKPQAFVITDPFSSQDQVASFTMTKGAAFGMLEYGFPLVNMPAIGATSWDGAFKRIGSLSDFTNPGSGVDGTAWIAGTAYYDITDPIYPQSVAFVIPNFQQYYDYFPASIRKGQFYSLNRPSGSLTIRKGGWREVKNSEVTSAEQHCFIRKSGNWTRSAKTGIGA